MQTAGLYPMSQSGLLFQVARYIEVWGAEFFKVSVGYSKETKTSNVIHSLPSNLSPVDK